jgi:hypothetical protein
VKVEAVYFIRQRGHVASVTLVDELGPQPADTLRRLDGKAWTIVGVEWFAMPRTPTRPGRGDRVGLLLSDEDWDIAEGDEVSLVRAQCPNDEHVRSEADPLYCKRCGWAVCYGCEHAFDLMCNNCDGDTA